MIDAHEDQAAGLRRLFRKTPPSAIALYAVGKHRHSIAVQAIYRLSHQGQQTLLLDESSPTDSATSLHAALDLPLGTDLLSVLGEGHHAVNLLQPVPGLMGRLAVTAAAMALPLLDTPRRSRLIAALKVLHQRADIVLVYANQHTADAPSPFVCAAPHCLIVAEVSRSGATEVYALIKQLAAVGAGELYIALARARIPGEAQAFFQKLQALVKAHVGVPLFFVGAIEYEDLHTRFFKAIQRKSVDRVESAFLNRLEALSHQSMRAATAHALE